MSDAVIGNQKHGNIHPAIIDTRFVLCFGAGVLGVRTRAKRNGSTQTYAVDTFEVVQKRHRLTTVLVSLLKAST